MEVHRVKPPAVPVIERAVAQRHGVHLQKARLVLGPLGAEGNLVAQQGARRRGGPAAVLDSRRDQQPVQRGSAGLEQGLAHGGVQAARILLVGGQPVGQARLEPHAAGLERRQPDGFERGTQFVRVVFLGPPNDKRRGDHGPCLERTDGRLAVAIEEFDQFVDDFGLVFFAGTGITITLFCQHFTSCF